MTAPTGNADVMPTPPSPALSALLGEAALIHGLDAGAADQVAQSGVLDGKGIPVVAMSIPPTGSRGIAYNDVALVCPIAYIKTPTAAQMAFLLEANFSLMTTLGCAIAHTKEGSLQAVHSTRLADLDARRLAEKQWSLLAIAVSIRQQLEEQAKAAQRPAGTGVKTPARPPAHAAKAPTRGPQTRA